MRLLITSVSAASALRFASRSGASPASRGSALRATSALFFDCDGVIVETEELHRLAYNEAFAAFGLEVAGAAVEWSVAYYDRLQNTVGGGKPKMQWHFTETCGGAWPVATLLAEARADAATDFNPNSDGGTIFHVLLTPDSAPKDASERSLLVDALQWRKTEAYKRLVSQVAAPRPGVLALMDSAIADPEWVVGICSASTRGGFEKVVDSVVGAERLAKLDVVIAGDDVNNKKPDPEIYNLARTRVAGGQLSADRCIVIEDSLVGLRAAKAANMKCLITYTSSTASEDFYAEGADAKLLDLEANGAVTLAALKASLDAGGRLIPQLADP